MKIDRERSKKMIKISTALVLSGLISVGSGIMISKRIKSADNIENSHLNIHFQVQQQELEYLKKVEESVVSDFDCVFVNLYRNGKMKLFDKEYNIDDLYIIIDEAEKNSFLVSYKDKNKDILTNDAIVDLKKRQIFLFKKTDAFYKFYKLCLSMDKVKDSMLDLSEVEITNFIEIINNYDGDFHRQVPETFHYLNLKTR